jgi:hypothetical protein
MRGVCSQETGPLIGMAGDPMTADERRLLELLAESFNGATDALMIAHGFTLDLMIGLVRRGDDHCKPTKPLF